MWLKTISASSSGSCDRCGSGVLGRGIFGVWLLMCWRLLCALLILSSSLCASPLPRNLGLGRLQLGKTYTFQYATSIHLSEKSSASSISSASVKDVGYQIQCQLQCSVIWQRIGEDSTLSQLVLIQMDSAQLYVRTGSSRDFAAHDSLLTSGDPGQQQLLVQLSALQPASLGDQQGGRGYWQHVDRVWVPGEQRDEIGRLLKGAASLLLQYSTTEEERDETDVSGMCRVKYKWTSSEILEKTKVSCRSDDDPSTIASQTEPLSAVINSLRTTSYQFDLKSSTTNNNKVGSFSDLYSVSSRESHQVAPRLRQKFGSEIVSLQSLQFLEVTDSVPIQFVHPLGTVAEVIHQMSGHSHWLETALHMTTDLPPTGSASPSPPDCLQSTTACPQLPRLVTHLAPSLTEPAVASVSAAAAYVALLPHFRRANTSQLLGVLKSKKNAAITLQLLDILAATKTAAAHRAAKSFLDWRASVQTDDIERHERYLVALSVINQPLQFIVEDLYEESKKKRFSANLEESVLLTTAALAKSYCSPATFSLPLCDIIAEGMTSRLRKCGSTDSACCLLNLRALRNLAAPATLSLLMEQVDQEDQSCSLEAMRTLAALPDSVIEEIRPHIESIFLHTSKQYSNGVRLLAAELLLRSRISDCQRDINTATLLLTNSLHERSRTISRETAEFDSYILKLVTAFAEHRPCVERALRHLLSGQQVHNYNVLALGALSSLLRRQLFADAGAVNMSAPVAGGFVSAVQMASKRALRQCAFTVYLSTPQVDQQLLQFSISAGGLSGLISAPDSGDDVTAFARLELQLLGRQLRPLQLFSSKMELMGHIWAGVGSEKTSAVRGDILLNDQQLTLVLQNGLSARVSTIGVATLDFAGMVEVSLWNRNAHALIETRGSVMMKSLVAVDTMFASARVTSTLAAELTVESNTDVAAHNGFHMCARIVHPPIKLMEVVRKQEHVPETQHRLRRVKRRTRLFNGATFNLNRKNSENCDMMFGDD
uniref:MTTP-like protein 3 n=1 Tax=Parasacculina yatsui TaxID=2836420 RepID=A0A8K1RBZ7_9CRUS|nr:MTTP-like protein 3 [Parasacculina yatsui]